VKFRVASRLVVLALAGPGSLAAVTAIGCTGATSQSASAAAMSTVADAMSRQWNAQAMHDGIRGDVIGALYASDAAERTLLGVDGVVDTSMAIMANFDAAAATAPPGVAEEFAEVRPHLAEYATDAVAIVTLAGRDRSAARARLPAFLSLFSQLKDELRQVDEDLLASLRSSQQRSRAAGTSARRMMLAGGLAGLTVFAGVISWFGRSIQRPVSSRRRRRPRSG
jgi:methyl-accepting chemotaxis protein